MRALTTQERARAEHLLAARLPCLGCHALNGRGGAIGPDLSQVGARRSADQLRAIVADPQANLPGSVMPRVPMSADTRERIIRYLVSNASTATPRSIIQRAQTTPNASGAQLYAQRCAVCHGGRGGGDGPNAQHLARKPAVHADAQLMGRRTDDRLFDGIYAGGVALGDSPEMPPYGETLTRAQIWSLVSYIRELCGCRQPAWANGR